MICPICGSTSNEYQLIDGVQYYECTGCESLHADPAFLSDIESNLVKNYEADYWNNELRAARERSYGSSLHRVAEVFLYSRAPIQRFLDIGSGPGFLLEALSVVMPEHTEMFHGVEMFPPPGRLCTHPNYHVSSVGDLSENFDAGVCIEVIEHLTPSTLDKLARQLASRSSANAIYYFGSGQPAYVKNEDPEYLDPHVRGHIVSYSIKALKKIFGGYDFNVIPLPGRDWAFLLERGVSKAHTADELLTRIWTPCQENLDRLSNNGFGPLMYVAGLESARCYLEHAISMSRIGWAQSLDREISSLRSKLSQLIHGTSRK